jgi:hypothetical protein
MPHGHRLFPKTVPCFTTSPVTCTCAGIVEGYAVGVCEICHNGNVNSVVQSVQTEISTSCSAVFPALKYEAERNVQ